MSPVQAPPANDPTKSSMNWADDVDDEDAPRIEERDEGNGIKVIIEYRTNAEGKKVKITRRIKRTLIKTKVNHEVAERKGWVKFGQEKGKPTGPHSATTTVGENVLLKMSAGNKKAEPEVDEMDKVRKQLADKKIQCRLCKGDHFTTKCPYKDTLEAIPGAGGAETPEGGDGTLTPAAMDLSNPAVGASAGGSGGKYVPPSMRAGAKGAGEKMGGGPGGGSASRDDLPTLRVTNLSEDADDDDLRELFSRYGRVIRVYVGRDRETGICKGYAFVSFESREDADRARQKVDGKGYDNLILSCQWSLPRGERPA
ncbi:eIF-3 RNA-binding subunit [Violaceomyces palustris]|uniref:EIF-3 RNA-binding subunit n=1 Tax=Violaceomyces palustris TaxID=1673888 RepID=A0ACD0NTA7_9BASI|nr:eIF-3 RNA-binding subunit [Violaceomyces palustris]